MAFWHLSPPPTPSPILKEGARKVSPYAVGGDLEGGFFNIFSRRYIGDFAVQNFYFNIN
jgi:hypothetical protein